MFDSSAQKKLQYFVFLAVELDSELLGKSTSLSHLVGQVSPSGWALLSAVGLASAAAAALAARSVYLRCKPAAPAPADAPDCSDLTCQLCLGQVPAAAWEPHRAACAADNRSKLRAMPRSRLRCPGCRRRLRRWPAGMGPPFKCR